MSLGLTMISDPGVQNTLVCGPTIPKDCNSITMYNGLCLQIDRSGVAGNPLVSSQEECGTEIAFLLDGSGSVKRDDFVRMKTFVKDLVRSLSGKDTKFAIAQFSTDTTIHYFFNTFNARNYEVQIDGISQLEGWTYTAAAIEHVVNDIFSQSRENRRNVKKVLIVVTDGQSNDRYHLQSSVALAERKNIVRFAIGVGSAFRTSDAIKELETIASYPSTKYVFRVDGFSALDAIRQNLQERIFSIEGSQTGGATLDMEMSQEGFSAAYFPGGIQVGVVGANQWRGGYLQYSGRVKRSYKPGIVETDSYLGYSMAVAQSTEGPLTILGAPRSQHRGLVMVVDRRGNIQKIDPFPWQFQSGEYFGAVVCAMDVDNDENTDLILISAPMYTDDDREGRVYVCTLTRSNVECHLSSRAPPVLSGDAVGKGRFGSSLAVLPDLNTDGFKDLVVGAPLENDNEGSIYIFNSEGRHRINPVYSQKIAGSKVKSGLKFFGLSISQSSFDLSGDKLPDMAVGSKGTVVLLRSRPIVMVETAVSFNPNEIPIQNECSNPVIASARVCFTMTRHSQIDTARATINFTLTLDATRKAPNNRAYIGEKQQREHTQSFVLQLGVQQCHGVNFLVEPCPEDALNALNNELRFSFNGEPSNGGLRPSLAQQAQTTSLFDLGFKINCGTDGKCVDNLNLDFNFSNSSQVEVGIDELLEVSVSLVNSEEDSYNSRVILTYPDGLSYRKFTALSGRIECNSLDSVGSTQGETDCTINKPIFKGNTKALFTVSYGIDTNSQLDKKIKVTANATSGNQQHSVSSQLFKMREIDVKYSILVTIESTLGYNNFSFGKNDLKKPVQQSIEVTNHIRPLNFTVVIAIPVKLGNKDIWADLSSLEFQGCQIHKDEEPQHTDFVDRIKENKLVDCSVAQCRVFRCTRFMGRLESETYQISGNLSSGWIEQIGLQTAKYILTSTARLEYDRNQYIFFTTESKKNPPIRRIVTEVEVYTEPDFTKEIVGGCLGGLALLALITAGLYKAGFFKSKYQEMMNDEAGQRKDGAGTPTELPE